MVVGLHEMYRSLKLFDCFNLAIRFITLLWSHSLGGSTITNQMSVSRCSVIELLFAPSGIKIFSAADAINWHLFLIPFISALYRASCIASGTISIHNNSLQIHNFKKLIPILHAPQ
jgi:hypothetical protein